MADVAAMLRVSKGLVPSSKLTPLLPPGPESKLFPHWKLKIWLGCNGVENARRATTLFEALDGPAKRLKESGPMPTIPALTGLVIAMPADPPAAVEVVICHGPKPVPRFTPVTGVIRLVPLK